MMELPLEPVKVEVKEEPTLDSGLDTVSQLMTDPSQDPLKVDVKEESCDDHTYNTITLSSQLIPGVASSSNNGESSLLLSEGTSVKDEDLLIKEEPVEDEDLTATGITFTPKPKALFAMPHSKFPLNNSRRKRNPLSLEQKGKVLDMLAQGRKIISVARQFKVNESTIRTIRNSEAKVRESLRVASTSTARTFKHSNNAVMVKVDKLLALFVRRQERAGIPVSRAMCSIKAKEFQRAVARRMGVQPGPFKASKGWAQDFYRRNGFVHNKIRGEQLSSDRVAAQEYPEILQRMIQEGGYTRDQIFNADETALYWKKMPSSTYISKETKRAPGVKPFKNRVSLLLGCNASGTCKLKPLLLHASKNPHIYRNVGADERGVFLRANKKAWMTSKNMNEWFDDMFIPEVRAFCKKMNIDFKCILLLDNSTGHANLLFGRHPNVKVVFLPPCTASILQPLDQELIASLKANYYRRTFLDLYQSTDIPVQEEEEEEEDEERMEDEPAGARKVIEYWKKFTIWNAVDTLLAAWRDVTVACIHYAWRPLLGGEAVAVATEVTRHVDDAVAIARRIPGFQGVTQEEVMDLISVQQEELTVEEMVDEADEEEDQAEEARKQEVEGEAEEEVGQLPVASLREFLSLIELVKDKLAEMDNQPDRVSSVIASINTAVQPYTTHYNQYINSRQQSLITRYFTPPQHPRTPSPQPVEEQEIDEIVAEIEDESVVANFNFASFEEEEDEEEQSEDPE